MFFWERVISVATFINYSYHYVYSNIYDLPEFLTQRSWHYLAMQALLW